MAVPKKVSERIITQLKRYQPILAAARSRDISESDTVVIIADMLADVLGYKKYIEITTEFAIRGTYVDLAVKIDNDVRFLVEAKAIGIELKDAHVKQAIDYGANNGIEWIILSNGICWRFYKIHFRQPIDKTLLFEIDMLNGNIRSEECIECFGNLSRECFAHDALNAFYQQQQILSRYSIANLILSDGVLSAIRRELKKIAPKVKIEEEKLKYILQDEVLKRDVVEGEQAQTAKSTINKLAKKAAREKAKSIEAKDAAPSNTENMQKVSLQNPSTA
ncbi:MAG: type I restriction enzyme HsdR N-terminal domain-containing protein [Ferrovibrio sp.]|uniref:type I restriction enzyme HsdR N-terminal domain-containing protein n=1 Tax=Ferrovibrio sp. TaxID=1917215 RepID=UPI00391C5AAC